MRFRKGHSHRLDVFEDALEKDDILRLIFKWEFLRTPANDTSFLPEILSCGRDKFRNGFDTARAETRLHQDPHRVGPGATPHDKQISARVGVNDSIEVAEHFLNPRRIVGSARERGLRRLEG